ncbi:hypothetical protein TNCV_2909181 [Trichonephila clavipes]|nr:hypothetical protein TNCV_2909181 [Trichonephila clavipes]
MVAERLAHNHTRATTVDELWHRVEAAWAFVLLHAIQSLFDSMPRRINAVITARGGCSGRFVHEAEPGVVEDAVMMHLTSPSIGHSRSISVFLILCPSITRPYQSACSACPLLTDS